MIVKITPNGLQAYITPADLERAERMRNRAAEMLAATRAGNYERLRILTAEQLADASGKPGPRPRFTVLLNPNAAKNSKTGKTSAVAPAHALRTHARNNRPRSISENITLQKLK